MSEKKVEKLRNNIRKRKAEFLLLTEQSLGSEPAKCIISGSTVDDVLESNDVEPLAKIARELAEKVLEARAEKKDPQLVLTLEKLKGQLPTNKELASLVQYSLLQSQVVKPRWLYFKNLKGYLQVVLLRINCLEKHIHTENGTEMKFVDNFFERHWIRMDPATNGRRKFWETITSVWQTPQTKLRTKISINGDPLDALRGDALKLEFLVGLEQMIDRNYPFVGASPKIVPTKEKYRKVTDTSPIFVLDCEMCITSINRHEITRISMVNEEGQVLLDTLVLPHNKITNYLTPYSGITAELLKGCKVRLGDVQQLISDLLPDDAILCGHTIECDLRALNMSHPFCIDIGSLYNFSRNPKMRTKLRTLSNMFLGEDIQDSKAGHCSIQDSLATLKLLKLKLNKGIVFGNVLLGWNLPKWCRENNISEFGTRLAEKVSIDDTLSSFLNDDTLNNTTTIPPTSPEEGQLNSPEKKCKSPLQNLILSSSTILSNFYDVRKNTPKRSVLDEQKIDGDAEEVLFDFKEAVRIDPANKPMRLMDCMKESKKRLLVAIKDGENYVEKSAKLKLINWDRIDEEASERDEFIASHLMENDVCLLEADCSNPNITNKRVDQLVETVVNATCRNGLVMVVFASPKKSILYIKLKK